MSNKFLLILVEIHVKKLLAEHRPPGRLFAKLLYSKGFQAALIVMRNFYEIDVSLNMFTLEVYQFITHLIRKNKNKRSRSTSHGRTLNYIQIVYSSLQLGNMTLSIFSVWRRRCLVPLLVSLERNNLPKPYHLV